MNRQREVPSVDDALDHYLLSTEEEGTDSLAETIGLYPQYEQNLRELSAFRKLGQLIGNPELSKEQEAALNVRAIEVAAGLMKEAEKC